MRDFRLCIIAMSVLCTATSVHALIKGSKTAVSVEANVTFPASDSNNQMLGFGWFRNGFTLENSSTSCVFDSAFPVSGNIILNDGNLILKQDMELHLPLHFEVGRVTGNFFSIEFPRGLPSLSFPTKRYLHQLAKVHELSIGSTIYSIDWSYDDKYLAVATQARSGAELLIYTVVNDQLVLVGSYEVGADVNTVRWHPSSYRLAIGASSLTKTLRILNFNGTTVSELATDRILAVYALGWNPQGTHIAEAEALTNQIAVYSVNATTGALTNAANELLLTSYAAQRNALSWDPSGTYIALGHGRNLLFGSELRVSRFTGSSLATVASLTLGADVYSVDWCPDNNATHVLAVGSAVSNDQFGLYTFDTASLALARLITAQAGTIKSVYSTRWCSDGVHITAGTAVDSGAAEVRVFSFDDLRSTLLADATFEISSDVNNVAYAHGCQYLAASAADKKVYLLKVTPQLKQTTVNLDNVSLFFNSAIIFQSQASLSGICTINGGGHTLELDADAVLNVAANSTLVLEDIRIKGLSGNKLRGADSSSTIVLRDVLWVQDQNTTFSSGALRIENDVHITGELGTIFSYQSTTPLSIASRSGLHIAAGLGFEYAVTNSASSNIIFEDSKSLISLNDALFKVSVPLLNLRDGQLECHGSSRIATPANAQLMIGNNSLADDFIIEVFGGSMLDFEGGTLCYTNKSLSSWTMVDERSHLRIGQGAILYLKESMSLRDGIVIMAQGSKLRRKQGKVLAGAVHSEGVFTTEIVL